MTRIRLSAPITVAAAPGPDGTARRRIDGIAVPWNVTAWASTGPVRFLPGSLPVDGPAPKLYRDHNPTEAIGLVTERVATDEGMLFSARISATGAGDEALTLAVDGVLDAVSVGVTPTEFSYEIEDGETVLVVTSGRWDELSLVPYGAFPEARVLEVAATPATENAADDDELAADDDPDPTETPTASEEEPMPEPVASPEATIPTPSLQLSGTRRSPRVTAGEFIRASITGDMSNPRIQAVLQQEALTDIPGLIPELLIGDVFDTLTDERRIVSALGTIAMPGGGETFKRRKVTQHTDVDIQNAEFDVLASQVLKVDPITVTKKWFGGTLELSEQQIAYSDVSLVDLIVSDMARMYAKRTETYAGTEIAGGASTAAATVANWTDGDEIIETLYLAAAEMWASSRVMPDVLIVDSTTWAKVGAAKDSGGNRIFPFLGPSNAAGTLDGARSMTGNPLGLQLIVSDDIVVAPATEAAILMNRRAIELYEDRRGALRVESPSTLSTVLAFRGVFAAADIDLANLALNIA